MEKDYGNKRIDIYLTQFLKESGFKGLTRSFLKNHIKDIVTVNGKQVKTSYKLNDKDKVNIDIRKVKKILEEIDLSEDIVAQKGELDILFETEEYLVLKKPKGKVVHPGIGNRDNTLASNIRYYLESKGEYDSTVDRAGIVHRIDKGVSGILVVAKNKEYQDYLKTQFQDRVVEKVYCAKVDQFKEVEDIFKNVSKRSKKKILDDLINSSYEVDSEWLKYEGYIGRDSVNRYRMIFKKYEFGGSKYALTYIIPISKDEVLLKIETGRMHQIRATLFSLGYTIQGDTLYSTKKSDINSNEIELESIFLSILDKDGKRINFCTEDIDGKVPFKEK